MAIARHWVASTSRTWLVPIPKAMAPSAPWVEVWLSPQAMVMPGWVSPNSGPMTWTIPCRPLSRSNRGTPKSRQFWTRWTVISSASPSRKGRA